MLTVPISLVSQASLPVLSQCSVILGGLAPGEGAAPTPPLRIGPCSYRSSKCIAEPLEKWASGVFTTALGNVSWQWIEGQVYFDFLHGLCFLYQRSRPVSYVKGRGDDSEGKPLPFASMRAAASAAVRRQMCISATGTWGQGPPDRRLFF